MSSETRTVLIVLANGVCEIETMTLIHVLKRAKIDLTIATIDESTLTIIGSNGISFESDIFFVDVQGSSIFGKFDGIVLPGGTEASKRIGACAPLIEFIKSHDYDGHLIAAASTSPALVLEKNNILKNRKATTTPVLGSKYAWTEGKVVCHENLITSNSTAASAEFALSIVKKLRSEAWADKIEAEMNGTQPVQ